MKFGELDINPAENPAILATGAWDPAGACTALEQIEKSYWQRLASALKEARLLPETEGFQPHPGSLAHRQGQTYLLAGLADGQQVFLEVGEESHSLLGVPLLKRPLSGGGQFAFYPTDAAVLNRFWRQIDPQKGPRALGATPRLGIGTRMTTAVWPGIFEAVRRKGFAANSIQNSVRELNLLDNLLQGRPPETNYACGFGTIETGYTGSTYEGLLVSGVLDAIKSDLRFDYGADADHVQVKRGPEGMARAKRVLDAARYYSFYTMDMSDVLDYAALSETSSAGAEHSLEQNVADSKTRRDVLAFHQEPQRFGARTYQLDAAAVGRFVGKYWKALDALETLNAHITAYKEGEPFDLELTIDEHPPEVAAFDCLTTDEEVLFLLREVQRRGLAVSHIAPNFGVEKGWDYRCPDGLEGLERRVRSQFAIAEEFGVLLDIHSGDDLTEAPRRVFQRATGGRNHFKVSPMLQILYARVLQAYHPDLFLRWWEDALAYAQREAEAGSPFALECLRAYESSENRAPSPNHMVFHHYSFAFVGRRDAHGGFLHRHEFYTLSPAFYQAYTDTIASYLCTLAEELF